MGKLQIGAQGCNPAGVPGAAPLNAARVGRSIPNREQRTAPTAARVGHTRVGSNTSSALQRRESSPRVGRKERTRMPTRTQTGIGLALIAALAWSATGPSMKYLLDTYQIPALTLAMWRIAIIAAGCFGFFALRDQHVLHVSWRELRRFALVGAFSIGVYQALWTFSIVLNGAAVAVVMVYTFPTFVTLGSWLLFRERPRTVQFIALLLSLLGCVLLARAYDPALLRLSWPGLLIGLGTGLAHAGYVLFSQRSVLSRSPWTSLSYMMLFGAITLLAMLLFHHPADFAAMPTNPLPWLLLIALSLGPTLGGYALFTIALRYIPATTASLLAVAEAPAGALLAFLLLGEKLESAQLLGVGLIVGAMLVPQIGRRIQALSTSIGQREGRSYDEIIETQP